MTDESKIIVTATLVIKADRAALEAKYEAARKAAHDDGQRAFMDLKGYLEQDTKFGLEEFANAIKRQEPSAKIYPTVSVSIPEVRELGPDGKPAPIPRGKREGYHDSSKGAGRVDEKS